MWVIKIKTLYFLLPNGKEAISISRKKVCLSDLKYWEYVIVIVTVVCIELSRLFSNTFFNSINVFVNILISIMICVILEYLILTVILNIILTIKTIRGRQQSGDGSNNQGTVL